MSNTTARPNKGHYPDPKLFLSLFKFRGDTFAEQQSDGSYLRISRRPTIEDLLGHFNHSKVIALYPAQNSLCYLGVIDVDIPHEKSANPKEWEILEKYVRYVVEQIESIGIESFLVERTGGRGMHIWVFSNEISVYQMHDLLKQILNAVNVEGEIFPIDSLPGSLGKPIRPPFGTHRLYPGGSSKIVDPHTLQPIELTDELIETLSKNRLTSQFFSELGLDVGACERNWSGEKLDKVDYSQIPVPESFEALLKYLRYCTREIYLAGTITEGGQGWAWMSSAACELMAKGATDEMVHQFFSAQKGHYKRSETAKNLRPLRKKGIHPTGCIKLKGKCSNIVLRYCDQCHVEAHKKVNESLEKAINKNENKEERKEGIIEDTIKQFDLIGQEVLDSVSNHQHLILCTGPNTGKSWTTIGALRHTIIEKEKRVNYVVPNNAVKEQVINRLKKENIPFIDNPSGLQLCKYYRNFEKLKYVPKLACQNCLNHSSVEDLNRPVMKEYYETYALPHPPFFGDTKLFEKLGDEFEVCPRYVYLAFLFGTNEKKIGEPLVNLMTYQKLRIHLFLPQSPLIPSLSSQNLQFNIVDQIDLIGRIFPYVPFSSKTVFDHMRLLRIDDHESVDKVAKEFEDIHIDDNIDSDIIKKIDAISYLQRYNYVEKQYKMGIFRKINFRSQPHLYQYDLMGSKPLKKVNIEGIDPKKDSDILIDAAKLTMEAKIDCAGGEIMMPLNLTDALLAKSENIYYLGMTSTPTALEANGNIPLAEHYKSRRSLLYPEIVVRPWGETEFDGNLDKKPVIGIRKDDGFADYINSGKARGNSETGGEVEAVKIMGMQYRRNSALAVWYMSQIFGDLKEAWNVYMQQTADDGINEAFRYKVKRIEVPPLMGDAFKEAGYEVKETIPSSDEIHKRILPALTNGGFYLLRNPSIPLEGIDKLVNEGRILKVGKKYVSNPNWHP